MEDAEHDVNLKLPPPTRTKSRTWSSTSGSLTTASALAELWRVKASSSTPASCKALKVLMVGTERMGTGRG